MMDGEEGAWNACRYITAGKVIGYNLTKHRINLYILRRRSHKFCLSCNERRGCMALFQGAHSVAICPHISSFFLSGHTYMTSTFRVGGGSGENQTFLDGRGGGGITRCGRPILHFLSELFILFYFIFSII